MGKNSLFQFKQFTVRQDRAAMKVSTDSCLLGGLAARYFDGPAPARIVDVGTGTGVLALMLAQAFPDAQVVGVEIEPHACQQARENFAESPWLDRLTVAEMAVQQFALDNKRAFDLLICNPPYFNHALPSHHPQRQLARHTDALPYPDLAQAIDQLLTENGQAFLIFPVQEWPNWQKAQATYGLHDTRRIWVTAIEGKPPYCVVCQLSRKPADRVEETSLLIYDRPGHYSLPFQDLLKAYYLNL